MSEYLADSTHITDASSDKYSFMDSGTDTKPSQDKEDNGSIPQCTSADNPDEGSNISYGTSKKVSVRKYTLKK